MSSRESAAEAESDFHSFVHAGLVMLRDVSA